MKVLAACIFAIALILRAAPICAAPVETEAVAMMSDCEGAPAHHDGQRGQKGEDAARVCHACVIAPVVIAVLAEPVQAVAVLNFSASEQLAGGALKPPTPPPRGRGTHHLSTQNWS